MTNEQILNALDSAIKGITVSTLGDSVLVAQQFDRFVDAMQRRTNVLQEARFMMMDSQQVNIDVIGFSGRVITQGITPAGVTRGTEADVNPAFSTPKLQASEFRAKTGIDDRSLRRNIERGGLENHLVDLMGEAAGRDWEEIALLGDIDLGDVVLGTLDGWLNKAGTQITTGITDGAATWPENLFEAALVALPKQYFVDPSEFRFYVPWSVENAYREKLKSRGTALGDATQTGAGRLAYKGIPVVPTAMLERSTVYDYPVLLSNPRNMVWGVFHEITIEPDRVPAERKTNFYLTVEGDVNYEEANGAVAVYGAIAT
jgi:hypothetical protein